MEINYPLRLIIIDFVSNALENIQENVTRILTAENTRVIMVVNRHILNCDDGILSRESIVGVIIFGGHCTDGFLIDYLVIGANYKYLSFGALLINIAQSYSSTLIKKIDSSSQNVQTIFVSCREEDVGDYYRALGFSQIDDLTPFDKNGRYNNFGDRIDYSDWKDSTNEYERLSMFTIRDCTARYINRINPGTYLIEDSLYDKNKDHQELENILFANNMEKWFVKAINEYINEVRRTPISKQLLDLLKKKTDSATSIYQVATETWSTIPLGNLYNKAIDYHFGTIKHDKNMKEGAIMSKLLTVFLLPCNIMLYPPAAMGIEGTSDHSSPCWIQLQCEYCKKNCLVKKENGIESYVNYLLKVLFGTWASHVFCFVPSDSNDEWYSVNRDWHICEERRHNWFKELKSAQHSDAIHFDQNNTVRGYFVAKECVKKFLGIYLRKHDSILSAITTVLVDLKIQSKEENQIVITSETPKAQISALLKKKENTSTTGSNPTPKATIVDPLPTPKKNPAKVAKGTTPTGKNSTPKSPLVDPSPKPKKNRTNVGMDGKSDLEEDEIPLSQLLSGKSHATDHLETTAKEKRQRIRRQIGKSMDINNEKTPTPQLLSSPSDTREQLETKAKEKRQRIRRQIGQTVETDDEDSGLVGKKTHTPKPPLVDPSPKPKKKRGNVGKDGKSTHKEDEIPLAQLLSSKSDKREQLETKAKEKKQRIRKQIGQTVETDDEDSGLVTFRDPDIPKVKRGLPQIKENSELESRRSEAEKKWNKMVIDDYELQKKSTGIEFVKVKKCKKLHPASTQYLTKFRQMTKAEKIVLFEIEQYDSDVNRADLLQEDHFLLHLKDESAVVISKNWFDVDQDHLKNTDTKRINSKTIEKCYQNPNQRYNLASDEKRAINKACNTMTTISQIQKIKRLPDERNNIQYFETKFDNKIIRTRVKYIGIDMNNRSSALEDSWLKDNFNKPELEVFWNQLKCMKANEIISVPIGSSENTVSNCFIPKKDRGPPLKYIQIDGDDCLTYSLASALEIVGKTEIHKMLIELNQKFSSRREQCKMSDILDLMTNKNRKKNQPRTRCDIKKMKPKMSMEILQDIQFNVFYHCILFNHHSVVLFDKWIVDPIFPYCLFRDENYLRMCSEMNENEDTIDCITVAYKYQFKKPSNIKRF